jgi:uncharacterized protein YqgC (DUF456 family)
MLALTLVAVVLLIAGIVGSVIPNVPGAVLSLIGVYVYWWGTGFAEPSTALVAVITVLVVIVVVGGFFQDVIAARFGGASTLSAAAAGVVGFVCLFLTGPVGMLLGSAATVFALEYRRQRDAKASARAATAVVLATVGSALVELFVTVMLLLVMGVVILL